jgi:hypothetical protein
MFQKIKEFFLGKPKAQEPVAEVPYKVEAPVTEVAPVPPTPVAAPEVKKPPVKKAPVVKPAVAAKKPRPRKTPAK